MFDFTAGFARQIQNRMTNTKTEQSEVFETNKIYLPSKNHVQTYFEKFYVSVLNSVQSFDEIISAVRLGIKLMKMVNIIYFKIIPISINTTICNAESGIIFNISHTFECW